VLVAWGIPTLSQVRSWGTEHLTDAAQSWTRTATVWEDTFTQLTTRIGFPGGTAWEGAAADAAFARAHGDRMIVIGLADELHAAARIARTGAGEIAEARRAVLRVVEAAGNAGFSVGEDFSVTCPGRFDPVTAAARQAQAVAFATDLRATVGALVATDQQVAARLTAATAGLGNTSFPEAGDQPATPSGGVAEDDSGMRIIQAVDYKTAPPDAPDPGPLQPVDSAEDVRKVLAPLENGDNRPNKQLDSEADIRRLYDWLVRGSVGDDTKAGFPRRTLADGTVIGIRDSNKNGTTLQVDYPNGKVQKVHLPSSIISEAPQVPPVAHPPATLPPPQTVHPPAGLPGALPPDKWVLPPWLQNPSPPGFTINPVQPPPIMPWDVPDAAPTIAVPVAPATMPGGSGWSWVPEVGQEVAEASKTVGTWVLMGGVAVTVLFGLGVNGVAP
jgi:hypothetical protein